MRHGGPERPDVVLRNAEPSDCDQIFQWRNHPSVRAYSLNPDSLDYESHTQWFHEALRDERRVLLMAMEGNEDAGVLRYDIDAGSATAAVSIYVRPDRQGQGIGSRMMEAGEYWLREHKPFIRKSIATVSKQNRVSLGLFRSAGYGEEFLILSKKL